MTKTQALVEWFERHPRTGWLLLAAFIVGGVMLSASLLGDVP